MTLPLRLSVEPHASAEDVAESHARTRGCVGAYLDTFEYQARPFYETLGYTLFGTLDGYPPGYRQYHLAKRFTQKAHQY